MVVRFDHRKDAAGFCGIQVLKMANQLLYDAKDDLRPNSNVSMELTRDHLIFSGVSAINPMFTLALEGNCTVLLAPLRVVAVPTSLPQGWGS